ncbi:MAG: hypothetical protein K2K97_01160 [Muribaculaceae bacterium]|nr:hypothetical protein [Muribaculaceae bacterium]
MATYKSDDVTLLAPAEVVFAKLDNLEGLGDMIKNAPADQIPADKREMLEGISVTHDTITFPAGPMGSLTLRKTQSVAPTLIRLEGDGGPVPMSLSLNIIPVSAENCSANVEIDLQIPAMLKPMVNGPMKKMTTEFANMLRAVPFS